MRSGCRAFTLWELMVVVALVVFLFAITIENLLPLRGDAERVAVTATRSSIVSTIGLEAVRRTLTDGMAGMEAMDGANPIEWLGVTMGNYAGSVQGAGYESIPRGHWAFDEDAEVLVYRVRYPEYFQGSFTAPPVIRFRVAVRRNANGKVGGVGLDQLDTGTWTTDGSELARLAGVEVE